MTDLIKRSAQEIIASFPAIVICDGESLSCETRFIAVKPGESGYYPVTIAFDTIEDAAVKYAKTYNTRVATKSEQNAALAGSMFGWDCPGADPLNN